MAKALGKNTFGRDLHWVDWIPCLMASPSAIVSEDFQGAGKEPGITIWRIENFCAVPWPKEKYGKFFDGDSYIILHV